VEFALIFPVMMLLLMGLFDLGRAVYAFNTISDAARTASRVAIVDQTKVGGIYVAQTKGAEQATALGLDPAAISITFRTYDLTGTCGAPATDQQCVAEVTVPYTFSAITPIISNIVTSFTMSSTTRLPVERWFATP
jgi:Flp pilus assembly protein TadG